MVVARQALSCELDSSVTSASTAQCAQVTHVSLAATKAPCSSVAVPVPWLRQPSAEGALLAVGVGRVFPAVNHFHDPLKVA